MSLSDHCDVRKNHLAMAGFEDGGNRPHAKKSGQLSRTRKGKKRESPLVTPERKTGLLTS